MIVVVVSDKLHHKIQTIRFRASWIYYEAFKKSSDSRSYKTGYHQRVPAVDNDYGDVVVADFNFDGRDDFAVKKDSGGNGGPTYIFYLQNISHHFVEDVFLSKKMEFFPAKIISYKKSLVTYVHANAYQAGEHVYRLNIKSKSWRQVSHRFLTI